MLPTQSTHKHKQIIDFIRKSIINEISTKIVLVRTIALSTHVVFGEGAASNHTINKFLKYARQSTLKLATPYAAMHLSQVVNNRSCMYPCTHYIRVVQLVGNDHSAMQYLSKTL